jgi:hypothetical protein
MCKAVLVATAVLLSASAARAANMKLVPIGTNADGATWGFVDLASIQAIGTTRTYWALWANTAKEAALPQHIYYAMRQFTDDCAAHTSHYTYVAFYDHAGTVLSRADPKVAVAPIIPGTLGADIAALVCEGKSPITDQGFASIDDAVAWARTQAH